MNKRIVLSVILSLLSFSNLVLVSAEDRDEQGRTPLMNYVIKQEEQLKKLTDEMKSLKVINQMTTIPTDAESMIQELKTQLQQKSLQIDDVLTTTLHKIVTMIKNGADLTAQDNAGNTVLNHCETKNIYETLRDNGAPFQLNTWLYFNHKPLVKTAKSMTHAVLLASMLHMLTTNQKMSTFQALQYYSLAKMLE